MDIRLKFLLTLALIIATFKSCSETFKYPLADRLTDSIQKYQEQHKDDCIKESEE